jgi:hypothetical protein
MAFKMISRAEAKKLKCQRCLGFVEAHPEIECFMIGVTGCIQENFTLDPELLKELRR